MSTQSPTTTTKSPVCDARFWYCIVKSTDAKGKLNFEKLAEMTWYKNCNSAKVAFFTKQKQWRMNEVKGEDGVKKEVDAEDKQSRRKKKETIKGKEENEGKGVKQEVKQEVEQEVKQEDEGYAWECDGV